jgi:hypothetical protein
MPLFGKFPINILGGETSGESLALDYLSDTVKVSLHTSSYTYDQDTHETWSDVTNEVTGTGYTARGVTLTSKTISYSSGSNLSTFDADDASWSTSTITARVAVIYKDTGTNGTSLLIGYVDFGSDKSSSAGTFTIQWNASGIFTFTVT